VFGMTSHCSYSSCFYRMDIWLKPWLQFLHNLVNFVFEDIFIFYVTNMFVSSANKTLSASWILTLILLTWRIWWAPNNVSRWQMGFNSVFKGLIKDHLWITKMKKKYMYSVENSYYHSSLLQQSFSVWLKWTEP